MTVEDTPASRSTRAIEGERIVYVVWELTLRCDLACGHCGSRAGKARSAELTTTEALAVVAQLKQQRVKEVTLIGGEAYLHEGWTDVVRAITDAGIRCTMATGGRGLTLERAHAAAEAGMVAISVSIDGMRDTHDRQRGVKGSFDAALNAMENIHQARLGLGMNTQINRLTVPELEQLLDLGIDKDIFGWQVQITVPMGRAADQPDWLLQPYDLVDVIPRLAALSRRAHANDITFWPGNNIGYFGPHQEELLMGVPNAQYRTGCRAGWNGLGIEADGVVKGCPSLPTKPYAGGNIRDDTLETLRTRKQLRFTMDRTVDDLWGFCRTCYYAEVCMAGCTWMAHTLLGRPGNNPYCHHRAIELQAQGLRERVVLREHAPGDPFDHGLFELVVEPFDALIPENPGHVVRDRRRLRVL